LRSVLGEKRENTNADTGGIMKDRSGWIVSALLMLCGCYVLLTTLRSGAKEVMLIGDMPITWAFAVVLGLIGLVGGVIVLITTRSKKRLAAELPPVNGGRDDPSLKMGMVRTHYARGGKHGRPQTIVGSRRGGAE